MSFTNLTHVLAADLETSGTLDIDYPAGTSRGLFLHAFDHRIVVNQKEYQAPNDFTVTLNASDFRITWLSTDTIPVASTLAIQLDRPGRNRGRLLYNGVEIPGAVRTEKLFIHLGSPVAADTDAIVEEVNPDDGGEQELTTVGGIFHMDVPRNVTVTSAADDSGRTFTVEGRDVYGNYLIEEITGENDGTASGAKAFAEVRRVAVDDDTAGNVEVGFGNVLGIPVFFSSTAQVQRYENMSAVSDGTLTAAVTAAPTATTGDPRGTWLPNTAPNGNVGYTVEVETAEAGYLGAVMRA